MFWIILVAIFAGIFSYFATQNSTPVTVMFGPYIFPNLPLYFVILISIIATLLISGFLYILKSLSSSFKIHKKDDDLKNARNEVAELTKEIHKLELENTRLKSDIGAPEDENSI